MFEFYVFWFCFFLLSVLSHVDFGIIYDTNDAKYI